MNKKDLHHMMFPRRIHTVYGSSNNIREALVVRNMDRAAHEALHDEIDGIPLLGGYALLAVDRELRQYYENPLEGIDDFCRAVDLSYMHPKAKDRERHLGQLVVHTVREQIPFIKEGTTWKTGNHHER